MTVPFWVWAATIGGIAVLVAVDIWHARSPHEVSFREATLWSVIYVVVALAFGVGVWWFMGAQSGIEYFSGWLVEKSLSVDNLFIFAVILGQFAVPKRHQQKVLLWGVVGALVMRAVFIVVGAAVISAFAFVFVVFGLFLLWTAVGLVRSHGSEPKDMSDNVAVRLTRRLVPVHEEETADGDPHDGRLTRRVDGRFGVTPLFIAVAVILSVDLVFALDSIPAIFGITQNAYLVFTANALALLGLRALYFLLVGLLDRLVHLSYGLAFILAFIGVKLIMLYLHEDVSAAVPAVPTWLSLTVIVATLAVVTVTSLVSTRGGGAADDEPAPRVSGSEHDGTGSPTRQP
ncbi:TerC/Alx family metal homeostasis membrane protein [Actinomycetospora sp. TBRC 11914]|uniref:TerC/Alx family metal homeostasis membrane protein n=1 Tax=Actinomycetospora sp. TBRC 11914 TaxID=2729387 RepID=UPI00145F164B|nr:TerC/Alx family metal homeostasis membrane protein [Actinomycetospora sp. TBRC 11914]NMO89145.1 TerC/Alx family metal homeostasis membrane protein [Actinomycetospora sp. TBRC 11914]